MIFSKLVETFQESVYPNHFLPACSVHWATEVEVLSIP